MKPILFNTDMVRAILKGRKTVTRRVMKPQPWGTCPNTGGDHELEPDNFCGGVATGFVCGRCGQGVCPPYMKYPVGEALFRPMCWPGDILYVRETWCDPSDTGWPICYKADLPMHWNADETEHGEAVDLREEEFKWQPSIHMPKWAARIFLRVTAVRAERLQDITEEQARAEGAIPLCISVDSEDTPDSDRTWHEVGPALSDFIRIWDSTIKPDDLFLYGWDANPWVWVIEFERCERPEEDNHE